MGDPRYCIHGTKINDPCPECFKEAGQAPGCAACEAKDTEIRQQAERIKQLEGALEGSLREAREDAERRESFYRKALTPTCPEDEA